MSKFRVTLKNFIDIELTEKDYMSIGTTEENASISDIRNLINHKLFPIVDYDSFDFKERNEI